MCITRVLNQTNNIRVHSPSYVVCIWRPSITINVVLRCFPSVFSHQTFIKCRVLCPKGFLYGPICTNPFISDNLTF